ncbi:MAG TPA: glycosyltransferase family 4 protein [Myxococcales bacterium]|nr:glycosyltransferase family 4 protein [Myxococcales bacterium]
MRIAYVNYGNQSGVTPSVRRELTALGHEIVPVDPTGVLALRDPLTRRPRPTPRVLMSLAVSAVRYGPQLMHHRWNTVFAFDQHSQECGELLERARPDVVLQNGALFSPGRPPRFPYVLLLDNTCLLAERQPPVPEADMGAHIRFGPAWLAREREAYRRASAIATFSDVVKQSLIDDYGVEPGKVFVTGAGANVVPEDVRERSEDGQTLVFVGKERWRGKGGPILLEAFRMLRRERPGLKLILAGPTEKLDLPEGATNLGLVPFEQVKRLLAQATVFALPTLREPFGIAFIDAMLSRVPCVGTQVGAVPEIVGDAGICVPPADAGALARAIAALLDDPALRAKLGAMGRERVLQNGWLWPAVGRRLSVLLRSAANASSGRTNHADWPPGLEHPPP